MPIRRYAAYVPAAHQVRPKRFKYRDLPLWLQWGLPLSVAVAAIVALVLWVNYETNDVPSEAGVNSPNAIVEQNEQDETLMKQQQAPHTAQLRPGVTPTAGLKAAIATWLNNQIRIGAMNGPLTGASCSTTAGSTAARVAMKCALVTADLTYPFYGVVKPASGQITFCQRVTPPVYGMDAFPLSRGCLGVGVPTNPAPLPSPSTP